MDLFDDIPSWHSGVKTYMKYMVLGFAAGSNYYRTANFNREYDLSISSVADYGSAASRRGVVHP